MVPPRTWSSRSGACRCLACEGTNPDVTIDDDACGARDGPRRDVRAGRLERRPPRPVQRAEHAFVTRCRAERDPATGADRDGKHEGARLARRTFALAGHQAPAGPSPVLVRAMAMTLSTELLYGGAVLERHAGEPAYFLDSSDLRPARQEARSWFVAARASARAAGVAVPSAVAVMDRGREVYRYPAVPTVSGPTSCRGVAGR